MSLLAFSVGIGTSLQRNRLAGFLILATNVTYSFGNALARNSGSRFNLPVDWVGIMFYGIGIVQLCLWGVMFFRNEPVSPGYNPASVPQSKMSETSLFPLKQVVLVGGIFILIGAAIPIAESAIPERFREENVQVLLSSVDEKGLLKPLGIDRRTLEAFLVQDRAQAIIGRGLYPRYYAAGQGLGGTSWPSFERRDYGRLGFFIIGPQQRHVVLRIPTPPTYFPNAADILVLGCSEGEFLDAYMVVFLESPGKILVRSPLDRWTCPGSK